MITSRCFQNDEKDANGMADLCIHFGILSLLQKSTVDLVPLWESQRFVPASKSTHERYLDDQESVLSANFFVISVWVYGMGILRSLQIKT